MSELCTVFWNVGNLFGPGVVSRGPQTLSELTAKMDTLANVLNRIKQNGPDIIGLAEVETEALFRQLTSRLSNRYFRHWRSGNSQGQTGLGLLVNQDVFRDSNILDVETPSLMSRPRSMIVKCVLKKNAEPILVVVNHWRSLMKYSSGSTDREDRKRSARWLGDYLGRSDRHSCVLVFGDFNAEPFEPPFNETGLRSVRFFPTALWTRATPAYLYNTAWRHLPEPDFWEQTRQSGYQLSRPRTSHDSSPPVIFDQLMVASRALRNGPVTLEEQSVHFHIDQDTATAGSLKPQRWEYLSTNNYQGCSDHFPLVACFVIS